MTVIDTAQLAQDLLGPKPEEGTRKRRSVRILSDLVVNQIAAGEVVERPASVVKELVENSIDAGATNILVVLENGGHSSIEVLDNGCGMSRDDALLAIERFGTSKIDSADDLLGVATLGFRGEALPSIASVSRFSLATATAHSEGTEIRIDGGKVRDVSSRQLPQGTKIVVRQLFFNVPARKKFLRSERSETTAVRGLLSDIGAAYPSIRIRFVSDGQELMNLPPSANFYDRVELLGFAGDDPLEVESSIPSEHGPYTLTGVVSKPRDCIAGATRLRLLVNGRSVRDRVLLKAVRDGYGNFLKGDRFPSGVLRLEVPPEDIDVNVHPQKTEIRFRMPDQIFRLIRGALSSAFRRANISSTAIVENDGASAESAGSSGESWGTVTAQRFTFSPQFSPSVTPSFATRRENAPVSFFQTATEVLEVSPELVSSQDSGQAPESHNLRYLGQIFHCYLLFEGEENLVLVDMHAAHERVTHSRLIGQYRSGAIQKQLLLVPEQIQLSNREVDLIESLLPVLDRLGFECDRYGANIITIRSVPSLLGHASPKRLVLDLLTTDDQRSWSDQIERWIDGAVARLACHGSVRGGMKIEREEAYALLESIQVAELAAFCPHGRPVMLSLTKGQLESMFGRAE